MNIHHPFPIAAHSYFTIRNKYEAKRLFLQSQTNEPIFVYGTHLNIVTIRDNLQFIQDDPALKKTMTLVEMAALIQSDPSVLDMFRRANVAIIHEPKKTYVQAILTRVAAKVRPQTQKVWNEILERTGPIQPLKLQIPSEAVFNQYSQYLKDYAGSIKTKGLTTAEVLEYHLISTGLKDRGWKISLSENITSAKTNHRTHTIWIGKDYQPRTIKAKKRIVIHEIYGHALRGPQNSLAEAEGFAIVLEQLTSPVFKYRRSYRYLAVALGWGVLGEPMTFRQVFEILWRIMLIGSCYSESQARNFAFDEVCRAFRGGRPDIAGAVFLKDSIYFDANVSIWNVLITQECSYNEFKDIIEGRRTLLS